MGLVALQGIVFFPADANENLRVMKGNRQNEQRRGLEDSSGRNRPSEVDHHSEVSHDIHDGVYPDRYNQRDFEGGYNDLDNQHDDDPNAGRYENYDGEGYYGSNYGNVNSYNLGRDFESNAGYRDSYNRLTTGEWPEVEEARRRRAEIEHRNLPAGVTHRGKGPRAYQRSDVRIQEDIHDLLKEDPYVDASDVEVVVDRGEVTLSGIVEDKQTKRRIEDIIDSVSGVKDIQNRLHSRLSNGRIVNIRNRQA